MLLVYLAAAWAGGILLAYALWNAGALDCAAPAWPFAVLALAAAAAGLAAPRRSPGRLAALLCLFLVLGAWRYQAHPYAACPSPAHLAFYNGDEERAVTATVEGVVTGYPDVRDARVLYRVRASAVLIEGRAHGVGGDVLVQAPRFPELRYGSRIRATGSLQTPPVLDDFDYQAYLARLGIHSLMRRGQVEMVGEGQGRLVWYALYGVKARGAALLNRALPEPAAALANGMLLGIEGGIPAGVDQAFVATGASHVIVISGSNIALLSAVLMGGFSRLLGRRRAVVPVVTGIALYVLLTGADPAAVRAGLMGISYVFAVYLGRQNTAYVSLCAAALFMLAWNPLTLWDTGFQLSFAATLGLVLFTRPIGSWFRGVLARRLPADRARRAMGTVGDMSIMTLAAQVLTLPLILNSFGRLSLVSLVTNLLIVPAQPPIMSAGMATLVLGLVWEPLGRVLALIPWLFLAYTTAIVELAAAVPFASVGTGGYGQAAALIYVAVLAGALLWRLARRRGWSAMPGRRALAWAALFALPAWVAVTALQMLPDGRLHLFFVPGEGGEAALVTAPDGKQAWIWDGRGDGALLAGAARPLLHDSRGGVDVAVGPPGASPWPAARGIDPAQLGPGAAIRLAGDVTLARLASGSQPVLAVQYGQFRALLPVALSEEAQDALAAGGAGGRVTLLKTPGPGAGAWPTAAFLAAAAPRRILWPLETTYPPAVAELLARLGAQRVAPGAVLEVITDGERLWVRQRAAR